MLRGISGPKLYRGRGGCVSSLPFTTVALLVLGLTIGIAVLTFGQTSVTLLGHTITYLGRTVAGGNTIFTYQLTPGSGPGIKDPSHWVVGLGTSCTFSNVFGSNGVQVNPDPTTGVTGFKIDLSDDDGDDDDGDDDPPPSSTMTITYFGDVPDSGTVTVAVKAGKDKATGTLKGPNCAAPPPTRTLTVTASPSGAQGGTFTLTVNSGSCTPGTGTYTTPNSFSCNSGSQVTISNPQSPAPKSPIDTRYIFNSFSPSASATLDIDKTITINYTTQFLVSYAVTGCNGLTVTPPAEEWVNSGGTATGSFPAQVTNGGTRCNFVSDNRPATITGPTTITGTYKTQYRLLLSINPGAVPGGLSNISGATSGDFFDSNTIVNLTANALVSVSSDTRYRFSNWNGDCSGTSPTISVTMSVAKSCQAKYIQQFQVLFTQAGATGTVNVQFIGTHIVPFSDFFNAGSSLGGFQYDSVVGQFFCQSSCSGTIGVLNSPQVIKAIYVLDNTPPSLTCAALTPPNAFGWYKADVVIHFIANDTGSGLDLLDGSIPLGGVAHYEFDKTITGEGINLSISAKVGDRTGNEATASCQANIDRTPPLATITLNPAAPNGKNGWYTVNIGVDYTCSDALSGLDPATPCPTDTTITTDGIHNLSTGTIKDKAGNQSGASVNVKRDATPPIITGSRSPAQNAFGWNNTNVTVNFVCSDATSGIASCGPTPQVITTEGPNQSRTGIAEDNAGNTASAIVGNINIDKTPPIIVAIVTPPPDASGIVTTAGPVTVSFNCSDPPNASNATPASGIASCSSPTVLTAEGAHTVTGLAKDRADNIATTTVRLTIARQQHMILQVKIKDEEIPPAGEEMTVEIILRFAPKGLQRYDLVLHIGDATGASKIARIEKIESKTIDPKFFKVLNKQDFFIRFKAEDNDDVIRPAATNIVIAEAKLRILLPGRSLLWLESPPTTVVDDKGQVVSPKDILMIPQEFEVK